MKNNKNETLRTALVQLFIRLQEETIKRDRVVNNFRKNNYDKHYPDHKELLTAFKEKLGKEIISLERDIYFAIQHYYENFIKNSQKTSFSNMN